MTRLLVGEALRHPIRRQSVHARPRKMPRWHEICLKLRPRSRRKTAFDLRIIAAISISIAEAATTRCDDRGRGIGHPRGDHLTANVSAGITNGSFESSWCRHKIQDNLLRSEQSKCHGSSAHPTSRTAHKNDSEKERSSANFAVHSETTVASARRTIQLVDLIVVPDIRSLEYS